MKNCLCYTDRMIVIRIIFILIFLAVLVYLYAIMPRTTRRQDMMHYAHMPFAHRGLHGKGIPENSMPAFKAAAEQGFPIELDLHLTKDKRIIVFHDDTLTRMCGIDRAPEELTYSQIKLLKLKDSEEHIPLFRDVLIEIAGRVPIMIELKIGGRDMELCERVQHLLKNYKGVYLIQSFNTFALQWYKENAPQILRGQLSYDLKTKRALLPSVARNAVRFLACNIYGRPDFVSYGFRNRHNVALAIVHFVFRCPVALWTIRNKYDFQQAHRFFDIVIFEGFIPERELMPEPFNLKEWLKKKRKS